MADDPRDPGTLNPSPAPEVEETAHSQDASPAPDTGEEVATDEAPPPRQPFLGEIVQRRSWPLIAIVFAFGLFLAAVPFLFQVERSPFADALALYDRLCAARGAPSATDLSSTARALPPQRLSADLAALPCVPRTFYLPRMDPVEGRQWGPNRAFAVTLERRPDAPADGAAPANIRFLVEEEEGSIRWSPWPSGPASP